MIYHPIGSGSFVGVAHIGEHDDRQNYRVAITTSDGYGMISDDMWSPKGDLINEETAWHVTMAALHALATGQAETDDNLLRAWCKDHELDIELALLLVHEGS